MSMSSAWAVHQKEKKTINGHKINTEISYNTDKLTNETLNCVRHNHSLTMYPVLVVL